MLERQAVARAFSRAWAKTGNRMAARMAMMAMTTSNSMSVNALRDGFRPGMRWESKRCMHWLLRPRRRPVTPRAGGAQARSAQEEVPDQGARFLLDWERRVEAGAEFGHAAASRTSPRPSGTP